AMARMIESDIHPSLDASSATAVTEGATMHGRAASRAAALTPEAVAVAARPAPMPISPIVLAGAVRMAEFSLIMLIGLALYVIYLPPIQGLLWRYFGATFVIALLS